MATIEPQPLDRVVTTTISNREYTGSYCVHDGRIETTYDGKSLITPFSGPATAKQLENVAQHSLRDLVRTV
ncbi:hypothetical protein [Aurantimonas sp. C2-3-R2]|uniref:hypothetical protein n=1 Tax=Aurantimonas sp. C2-3-R2 TaxID=3114363 RepID=UPI002E179B4E|nr:hypothetical protein [Aurantimonas sp. C2-4-R8]